MGLIFLLYAFFASTFTLGKEAVSYVPPIFFIGIRMILAGILLLVFVKYYYKKKFPIYKKEHFFWFIPIILFHIYISYTFEFIGMQYLTSSKTCLFYNLSPFITALFSYVFFKEVMTPKKWLGLTMGFLGFIPLLISSSSITEESSGMIGFFSIGELSLLISVTTACIGWISMRKLTREFGYSYFFVNGIGMFCGGILALITSFYFETIPPFAQFNHFSFWRALVLLILIGNVFSYNLYGKLLHTYSATVLSFFGFFTPLFAALFGWLWLGETVSPSFFVTIGLVTIGLYLFYQEELKLGYIL